MQATFEEKLEDLHTRETRWWTLFDIPRAPCDTLIEEDYWAVSMEDQHLTLMTQHRRPIQAPGRVEQTAEPVPIATFHQYQINIDGSLALPKISTVSPNIELEEHVNDRGTNDLTYGISNYDETPLIEGPSSAVWDTSRDVLLMATSRGSVLTPSPSSN